MSNALLESVVKKNRARLIPFMLALYVLAFLDRSNIGFAKETYPGLLLANMECLTR